MKFKVQVIVKAETGYEVEIDADSEIQAEDFAVDQWRTKLPDDFQVDKSYITDWETEAEQLSWECMECGREITREQYLAKDEMCPECFLEAEAQ